MKKILITGANSYIGVNFEEYAKTHYLNKFSIDTVNMEDESWKHKDFSVFDTIFHVAGIAHADIGKVDETITNAFIPLDGFVQNKENILKLQEEFKSILEKYGVKCTLGFVDKDSNQFEF